VHFAAGPWFTVRNSGDDFEKLGQLWLSNGKQDGMAWLEYRVRFADDELEQSDMLEL